MEDLELTATSYVVLGLAADGDAVTSYDMKRVVRRSIGMLWHFPHSQLYAEPARLAEAGLLSAEREASGRRRRRYRLTPSGRLALEAWHAQPLDGGCELRDLAVLRLASPGIDVARLAAEAERAQRSRIEVLSAALADADAQRRANDAAVLRLGIAHATALAEFWGELARTRTTAD